MMLLPPEKPSRFASQEELDRWLHRRKVWQAQRDREFKIMLAAFIVLTGLCLAFMGWILFDTFGLKGPLAVVSGLGLFVLAVLEVAKRLP